MASLKDPYMKADRAKEHLDALKADIQRFIDSEPYGVSTHDDLQSSEYVITLRCDEPPLYLALIAGDFISCLRSALDHLAWQLALLNTAPKFPGRVDFPIWGVYGDDAERGIAKSTKQISIEAVSVIKSFQPYNCGPAYVLSHLWRLHVLWNVDKHRHITLRAGVFDTHFYGIKASQQFKVEYLDDGCIMRLPLSDKPKSQLEPVWDVSIVFGDEQEGVDVTIDDLIAMHEFVREKVIPAFACFFP